MCVSGEQFPSCFLRRQSFLSFSYFLFDIDPEPRFPNQYKFRILLKLKINNQNPLSKTLKYSYKTSKFHSILDTMDHESV